MPLSKSKSKKAFDKNVAKEIDNGKSQKQALAIAFSEQGKTKKKAKSKSK